VIKLEKDFGLAPIEAIHTNRYIDFLSTVHSRWMNEIPEKYRLPTNEVLPRYWALHHSFPYHSGLQQRAGWHMADASAPINAGTWEAARASCNVAIQATQLVLDAAQILDSLKVAYGCCRPPGHHAGKETCAGFCYINNTAAAAQYFIDVGKAKRVAIIDIDLHHGNGTQDIFYDRSEVLTCSVHAETSNFYPFFTGYENERGHGKGEGYNYNFPIEKGSDDGTFLAALERILCVVSAYRPHAVVVALGLDAFKGDPFATLAVTTEGFAEAAKRIANSVSCPTVIIQEGGYDCEELGKNLVAFLQEFSSIFQTKTISSLPPSSES